MIIVGGSGVEGNEYNMGVKNEITAGVSNSEPQRVILSPAEISDSLCEDLKRPRNCESYLNEARKQN